MLNIEEYLDNQLKEVEESLEASKKSYVKADPDSPSQDRQHLSQSSDTGSIDNEGIVVI